MENKVITVTSPLLPSLDDFIPYLQDIWNRKWLTNNGHYHQELEKALCEYLKVPYISLFTNGTLPLICALQALRITGEVITTPYSFVATTHSLWWNGIKPVFVDIDPETQQERILKRNGAEKLEMFQSRWIPMEEMYFSAFDIKKKCEIQLNANRKSV